MGQKKPNNTYLEPSPSSIQYPCHGSTIDLEMCAALANEAQSQASICFIVYDLAMLSFSIILRVEGKVCIHPTSIPHFRVGYNGYVWLCYFLVQLQQNTFRPHLPNACPGKCLPTKFNTITNLLGRF